MASGWIGCCRDARLIAAKKRKGGRSMRASRNPITVAVLSIAFVGMAAPAPAAESDDSCSGLVTALPTVITVQGTWCLQKDLAISASNARAIEIQSSNVTIDCNGFKLSNVGAGTDTQSVGIYADGVANIRVRHCTIQG